MKIIYKYDLTSVLRQTKGVVMLPRAAEFLRVGHQNEKLYLWALVRPEVEPMEEYCFEVFGTGEVIPTDMGVDRRHIGSTQMGSFVWHVFLRVN